MGDSFSAKVMVRILKALDEGGPEKRLRLSCKTNQSYNRLIDYVYFMCGMDWIEIFQDDEEKTTWVKITESGKIILDKLSKLF